MTTQTPEPPATPRKGGLKPMAKEEVWEARRRYKAGEGPGALAQRYGVSTATIRAALFGRGAYSNI